MLENNVYSKGYYLIFEVESVYCHGDKSSKSSIVPPLGVRSGLLKLYFYGRLYGRVRFVVAGYG